MFYNNTICRFQLIQTNYHFYSCMFMHNMFWTNTVCLKHICQPSFCAIARLYSRIVREFSLFSSRGNQCFLGLFFFFLIIHACHLWALAVTALVRLAFTVMIGIWSSASINLSTVLFPEAHYHISHPPTFN